MNEIVLRKIANSIFINVQNVDAINIFSGKTGITLFLYHYGSYCGVESYTSLANELIDEISETISIQKNNGTENTLAAIGWCLNHLIKNDYLNGDPDEILADIDEKIITSNINIGSVISSNLPILFNCHYLLCRIKNNQISIDQLKYAKTIIRYFNDVLINENGKKVKLDFLNSALYFLINICTEEIDKCDQLKFIEYLNNNMIKAFENGYYDKSDLRTLSRLLKNSDFLINENFRIINNMCDQLIDNIDDNDINTFIKDGFQNLLYFEEPNIISYDIDINNKIDELISNLSKDDLSLENGLAGIGLRLLQISKD